MAESLGVSTSIVSGYETGERTPSVENLLSLSYLYNCSTDYLLGKQTVRLNADGLTDEQIRALSTLLDTMKK